MPGTILITGGAQRFGRELALALADTGYRVVITYRRERDNLVDLSDAGIRCLKADFKNADTTQAFVTQAQGEFDSLRAIVHNASDWLPESVGHDPVDVMAINWNVHVQAPYLLNISLEEQLLKGAKEYGMADIIHLTDYVVERGSSKHIAYAASKAALHNLTLSFAAKLAPHVKVNSIAPALLMYRDTDDHHYKEKVARKSLLPPGPGALEGIQAVNVLLDSRYITGRSLSLDGGRHLKAG